MLQKATANYQAVEFRYVPKVLHLFQNRILLTGDNYKLILISLKLRKISFFFHHLKQVAALTKIQH